MLKRLETQLGSYDKRTTDAHTIRSIFPKHVRSSVDGASVTWLRMALTELRFDALCSFPVVNLKGDVRGVALYCSVAAIGCQHKLSNGRRASERCCQTDCCFNCGAPLAYLRQVHIAEGVAYHRDRHFRCNSFGSCWRESGSHLRPYSCPFDSASFSDWDDLRHR